MGSGGVGTEAAKIAARRDFFERCVVPDYELARAEAVVASVADPRFSALRIDASDATAVAAVIRQESISHVLNAVDPRFVRPVFEGAFAAGADYLDMAMSLSRPHPDQPHQQFGVKLGDEQFAQAERRQAAGRLALVGVTGRGEDGRPRGVSWSISEPGSDSWVWGGNWPG